MSNIGSDQINKSVGILFIGKHFIMKVNTNKFSLGILVSNTVLNGNSFYLMS